MSETAWIIGEIIVGIAFLGVLSAVITLVMVRLLPRGSTAAEILRERYARGELTREQYQQMRQDLETTSRYGDGFGAPQADGRDVGVAAGPRQAR